MGLLVMLSIGACTNGGDDVDDGTDTTRNERVEQRPSIRIAVTDWTGARLNVAIAEEVIERRLGYPVSAIEKTDTSDLLTSLEAGDLDAVLELWPSGLEEREQAIIDRGRIESLGPLGVEAKVGWYVPRYLVEDDPSLATWEGFADPAVAARFGTSETGGRGRFLGTDPGYAQFDEVLIEGLDLSFDVVYSGSDAATRAELERRTGNREPVLLYWWTPTAEVVAFDLINVALPERTEACLAEAERGPLRCDYPVDVLFKLASPELADKAPDVHRFLTAFTLDVDEQARLIHRVEFDGLTIEAAATEWIDDNTSIWERWLDQG